MNKFDSITRAIIKAAQSLYPEWKTFEVRDDFPDYKESFVWDSLEALKDMRIDGLDIQVTNDTLFRVRCRPTVFADKEDEIPDSKVG